MSDNICIHPACNAIIQKKRACCGRHWFALPAPLRNEFIRAGNPNTYPELISDAVKFFESQMIGPHEKSICRGKDCGATIVWMPTTRGKKIPVDVDAVQADDRYFETERHVAHWATCPNADKFRRPKADAQKAAG